MLTGKQRHFLLAVARSTLQEATGAAVTPPPPAEEIGGNYGGIFVTLRRGGELRGCIGNFRETSDLVESVRDTAKASQEDPRFVHDPVSAAELDHLEIEISLLSARTPMQDIGDLTPGRHGVLVRRGNRSGCFLPKVASERGWSAEQFLANCCTTKAGLAADAWKEPDTDVLLFTAEAFSE